MLTQCTRCATVFRVHPAQLRQAQGFVRCGSCKHAFYAVDRLIEETAPPVPVAVEVKPPRLDTTTTPVMPSSRHLVSDVTRAAPPVVAPHPAPENPRERFDIASPRKVDVPSRALANELPEVRRHIEETDLANAQTDPPEPRTPLSEPDRDGPCISIAELDSEPQLEHEPEFKDIEEDDQAEDDAPEVLQQDLAALRGARRERRGWIWFWSALSLLLLLSLVGQVSWRYREPLLAKYPDWQVVLERWCRTLGCQVDPIDETADLELLARDVRDHPRFADTLLVNLTLVHHAAKVRRYPTIELSLIDRSGQAIGKRRFAPEEYLDPSIDARAGMQPSRPVFVVLEVAGPHADAASFEFDFL